MEAPLTLTDNGGYDPVLEPLGDLGVDPESDESLHPESAVSTPIDPTDPESLGPYAERFQDRAYRLSKKFVRDPEAARDVVQDSFLAAVEALGRFRVGSRFSAWFLKIVANRARNQVRQAARRRSSPLSEEVSGTQATPEEILERREAHVRLRYEVDVLPDKLKQMVSLRYGQGLTCSEIAVKCGVSEGAVRVALFRAREILRSKITGRDSRSTKRAKRGET